MARCAQGVAHHSRWPALDMAPAPMTERRLSGWNRELLISAAVHRHVVAQKIVAAARSNLAECDADAKKAGLDLRTLCRATVKAAMTPADHRREADADAYLRAMGTVAFGACSEEPRAGAFPPAPPPRMVSPLLNKERSRWRPTTQTNT